MIESKDRLQAVGGSKIPDDRIRMIEFLAAQKLPFHLLYQVADPYFPVRHHLPEQAVKDAFARNSGAALWVAVRVLGNFRVAKKQLAEDLPRAPENFDSECRQCGRCCVNLMPTLLEDDLVRWRSSPKTAWIAELWGAGPGSFWAEHQGLAADPFSDKLPYCPFLFQYPDDRERAFCSIHPIKPANCIIFGISDARQCARAGQLACAAVLAESPKLKKLFRKKRSPLNDPWDVPDKSVVEAASIELIQKIGNSAGEE
jgi:hypothetical protein